MLIIMLILILAFNAFVFWLGSGGNLLLYVDLMSFLMQFVLTVFGLFAVFKPAVIKRAFSDAFGKGADAEKTSVSVFQFIAVAQIIIAIIATFQGIIAMLVDTGTLTDFDLRKNIAVLLISPFYGTLFFFYAYILKMRVQAKLK